jgi:hypothetical protein
MDASMSLLKFFPEWVYWIVISALLAFMGVQQLRIGDLKVDVAGLETKAATELSLRLNAALVHTKAMKDLGAQHAQTQQTKEDTYNAELSKLQARNTVAAANTQRLQSKLAAYTASGRRAGETDTAAIERFQSRLQVVGGLLEEGIGLLEEGRFVIEGRDLEVKNLLDQIHLDRATCNPATKSESGP